MAKKRLSDYARQASSFLFSGWGGNDESYKTDNTGIEMPTSATRSSEETVTSGTMELEAMPRDYPRHWFDTLENLAINHSEFANALDNIVQLGNKPHTVEFSDEVPEELQKEMLAELKRVEDQWYKNSSGMHGLKADLLTQVVINGAISAESIPTRRLDGIGRIVRVPPKAVIFVYDKKKDYYVPYQESTKGTTIGRSVAGTGGLIELNERTYSYIGWRRYKDGPYPQPPFMSAVESLLVQSDMKKNLKEVIKKLGILGIFSVMVEKLKKRNNETDEQYAQRSLEYLTKYVQPQVEKSMNNGAFIGFKDSHEFDVIGNQMNVQGAEGLVKIVETAVFSGLKQDPNMLGRNFSTTETFGRVIMDKMSSQAEEYQRCLAAFLEKTYALHLKLAGFQFEGKVFVTLEKPTQRDVLKEAQAEKYQIDNVLAKRGAGIIDQTQAAQELGYEKPAEEWEFTQPMLPGEDPNNRSGDGGGSADGDGEEVEGDGNQTDSEGRQKTSGFHGWPLNVNFADPAERDHALTKFLIKKHLKKHGADFPSYIYEAHCPASCDPTKHSHSFETDFDDPKLTEQAQSYYGDIKKVFERGMQAIAKAVADQLSDVDLTDAEQAKTEAFYVMVRDWSKEYADNLMKPVEENVDEIYSYHRQDKSIFSTDIRDSFAKNKSSFDVPDATFDIDDYRAIEFYRNADNFYLGKFITDEDLKRAVYNFIGERYIDGMIGVGPMRQDHYEEFVRMFKGVLDNQSWKIRRVIDTTVNKTRNFANVGYMNQIGIQEYKVVEILDRLTCDWCTTLDGMTFSIQQAKSRVQKEINATPESISQVAPFATSVPISDFKKLSAEELAAQGYNVPAFHPHCRGRLVALPPK